MPVTRGYIQFSFNYIESPLFQERIAQILAGEIDPRDVDWDELLRDSDAENQPVLPSTQITSEDTQDELLHGFSLGLFIPLVICSTFLFFLFTCVIYHSLNKKCTTVSKSSFSSIFRSTGANGTGDASRNSTRSQNAMHRAQDERLSSRSRRSTAKQPIFTTRVSRLGSIRESPEDYYKGYVNKGMTASGTITPDSMSSMSSIFSKITGSVNSVFGTNTTQNVTKAATGSDYVNVLSNSVMYPPSETTQTPVPVLTRSSPDLLFTASLPRDGIVPYRLTWITPLAAHSEPVLVNNVSIGSASNHELFTQLEKKIQNSDVNVLSAKNILNNSKISDKSPFHPNNNTPTTGSDGDNLPGDVFINHTHSMVVMDSILSTNQSGTPNVLYNSAQSRRPIKSVGSTPGTDYSQRSYRSVSISFPNTSVGSWHYNDIYRAENQSLAKNILARGNVALNNNNASTVSKYPPQLESGDVEQKGKDSSMYPNIGSSNTSMTHQNSENQLMIRENSEISRKVVPLSTNTSMCAHMDSNETSQSTYNSSVFTGINGEIGGFMFDRSGQDRGHSTSIEHTHDSNQINDAGVSYVNETTTTSDSIRALSAIHSSTLSNNSQSGSQQTTSGSDVSSNVPSFASTTRSAPAILTRKYTITKDGQRTDTPMVENRKNNASHVQSSQRSVLSRTYEHNADPSVASSTKELNYKDASENSGDRYFGNSSGRGSSMATSKGSGGSSDAQTSEKSLAWDDYFFFLDELDENRRGSAGTVRNMRIEQAKNGALIYDGGKSKLACADHEENSSNEKAPLQENTHGRANNQSINKGVDYDGLAVSQEMNTSNDGVKHDDGGKVTGQSRSDHDIDTSNCETEHQSTHTSNSNIMNAATQQETIPLKQRYTKQHQHAISHNILTPQQQEAKQEQNQKQDRRYSDQYLFAASARQLTDHMSRDDYKRHSAQAIIVSDPASITYLPRRRSAQQPLLEEIQYWV